MPLRPSVGRDEFKAQTMRSKRCWIVERSSPRSVDVAVGAERIGDGDYALLPTPHGIDGERGAANDGGLETNMSPNNAQALLKIVHRVGKVGKKMIDDRRRQISKDWQSNNELAHSRVEFACSGGREGQVPDKRISRLMPKRQCQPMGICAITGDFGSVDPSPPRKLDAVVDHEGVGSGEQGEVRQIGIKIRLHDRNAAPVPALGWPDHLETSAAASAIRITSFSLRSGAMGRPISELASCSVDGRESRGAFAK